MELNNIEIDGIPLEVDDAFKNAMKSIINENKNVFITGSAGTGKTFFLKTLCKISKKRYAVVAPTGVAALNATGVTIHSFFNFPTRPLLPNENFYTFNINSDKINLFKKLELLIIDEISMVRCDLFINMDKILRYYRKVDQPFGGVQIVIIGDPFQIPPVVGQNEYTILRDHYKGRFFFSTNSYRNGKFEAHELKIVKRQSDSKFINFLNRVRLDQILDEDLRWFNKKLGMPENDEGFIYITSKKDAAKAKNEYKLNEINEEQFHFKAIKRGTVRMKEMVVEENLYLKKGAQVMFLVNKDYYVNGTIGKIVDLSHDMITVEFEYKGKMMTVNVKSYTWDIEQFIYNNKTKALETEVIGSITQFPVKLAWSITIHKSQGLTFDKVIADLNSAFVPGQIYVGLSRCTNVEGLFLETPVNQYRLRQHPRVVDFYNNLDLDRPF